MWSWRRRDDGQVTAEYLGVIVLVALVIAAVTAVLVLPGGGPIAGGLRSAVCRIAGLGCGDGATGSITAPGVVPARAPAPAGAPAESSDCHGFWGCTWGGVKQVGSGFYNVGKGAVDDVTGLFGLVGHPGRLLDAGKYVVAHPLDAGKQLIWDNESSKMWDDGDYGGSIGRTAWNVGSWFIPYYDIGKAGSKVGKLGELGKLGEVADKLADLGRLADDAGTMAKTAEEAAARGDLAAADKAAAQARADADAAKARAREAGCPVAAGLIPGRRAGLVLAGGGGRLGAASVPLAFGPRAGVAGCGDAEDAAARADQQADAAEAALLNNGLGPLVKVKVDDPAALALAEKLGGEPSVKFANGPPNEFDTVSDLYVAQSKPANFTLNKAFRDQAKVTFDTAVKTGRRPYFHFEGPPGPGVLQAIQRYTERYGVEPVIDTVPLKGP